ncbi:MAG: hypothetical protein PHW31_04335 [Candidatus Pacebacteria bacterium]|nr:hypothetical protein [Candidatus Paceibacterota bacterium]
MEKQKKKKNRGGNFSVDYSSSENPILNDSHSEEEPSGQKLRIVYLSKVPKKDDVGFVADVLIKLGKPRELAETAHNSGGKVRLQVYMGYSKHEANEIAWQLENAGAKLFRC